MGENRVRIDDLRSVTADLDVGHPLRLLVARLPAEMPASEYAALLPSLWELASG
jgi:hypothetical protein